MALNKINVEVILTEINCGECGGTYAINERYRAQKYENGGSWNCPYCECGWGYSDNNENSQLKKKLQQEEKRRKWAEQAEKDRRIELENARKKLSAQKGVNTKMKNRAKAGGVVNKIFTPVEGAASSRRPHPKRITIVVE